MISGWAGILRIEEKLFQKTEFAINISNIFSHRKKRHRSHSINTGITQLNIGKWPATKMEKCLQQIAT